MASRSRNDVLGPAQRDHVDQGVGDRRHRLLALALQVEVLDDFRLLLEAVAADEVVVEVLLARAHAADIQRDERPHRVTRGGKIVRDEHVDGGGDVKAVERAPDAIGAFLQEGAQLGDMLGREQRGDPAVGDLAGKRRVLGADRGEIHGNLLLDGSDRELQSLAGTVGQRQLERLAMELEPFARERLAHDGDVLARALQLLAESLAVPALGDLRPGGADAEDHAPTGELVDRGRGHRGHRGRAARHLEDARAEADLRGLPGKPGEHRGGVGAVSLGGPHRVIAELLGFLDDFQLILGAEAETPVADVYA